MRNAFVNTIYKAAEKDPNVMLLLGDIGAFLFRKYYADFPERILNMGVAEANMTGVAAGLAMNGKRPFCYSITPFVTARCYEQVKDDVAYPNLNVTMVGVGAGIAYSPYGPTHHAIDDISLMRGLPNMTVVSPADPQETEDAILAIAKHNGPVYLRLALECKPLAIAERVPFKLGKANFLRRGKDVSIVATGEVVMFALEAAELLAKEGIEANVLNVHTIKPLDVAAVREASQTRVLVTVEEHNVIGGLGSAVAEVLAESPAGSSHAAFGRIGLQDEFAQDYGNRLQLLKRFGISTEDVVEKVLGLLK